MLKNNLTIWSHCSHARCLNESATLCLRMHDWNLNRFIYVETSVTRFGKTLPLWQNLPVFGKFSTAYLVFGKMLSLLWQIWSIIWLIFIFCKWKNIDKYSNHLVTLVETNKTATEPSQLNSFLKLVSFSQHNLVVKLNHLRFRLGIKYDLR